MKKDDNILLKACIEGHLSTIKILIKQKKLMKTLINSYDDEKRTPLIWASWMGYKEIVYFLLKVPDIDLNKKDIYGQTALDISLKLKSGEHKKIYKLLMDYNERKRHSKVIDRTPS